LKGAKASRGAPKADLLSVIGMVESLNFEILQASAFIADTLKCGNPQSVTKEMEQMVAQAKEILGHKMVVFLRQRQPDGDPMLIQVALQAYMVNFCKDRISALVFYSPQCCDTVAMIYATVQEPGMSAIFCHEKGSMIWYFICRGPGGLK
jgi:hypothetical protein